MNELETLVSLKLGARSRAFRQHNEMDQPELSLVLGCLKSSVSEIEIGQNMMTVPRLVQYAWHLGVKPETLLRGLVEPETLLRLLGKPENGRVKARVIDELFRFADDPVNQGPNVKLPLALRKNSGAQAHLPGGSRRLTVLAD